jgi:hypothetical protein
MAGDSVGDCLLAYGPEPRRLIGGGYDIVQAREAAACASAPARQQALAARLQGLLHAHLLPADRALIEAVRRVSQG